jgi:CPA2 family monovalent cation:H+ antiporter-2
MLLDPWQVLAAPSPILATLAIVMIGKPLAAMTIVAVLGYSSRVGLGVAIALAQIGEFSFLLAVLGRNLGVLPDAAMNPIVTAAIVSIMLNPMLYRTLGSLEAFLARHPRLWRLLNRRARGEPPTSVAETHPTPAYQAVIVGHGPIGQTIARLLRERGIEPTIIEMNVETCRSLRRQGQRAVYGDANQTNVLEQAGIAHARTIILSASGSAGSVEAIRAARKLNPKIHVVARADYLGQAESLLKVGADEVVSGEGEVVLAMTDSILRRLGATPDQMDEERARIRAELFHRRQ